MKCIDFDRSFMDAEAIRFMNEGPGEILKALPAEKDIGDAPTENTGEKTAQARRVQGAMY